MAFSKRLSAWPNAFACPGSPSPCSRNAASRAEALAWAFANSAIASAQSLKVVPSGSGPVRRIVTGVPVEVDPAFEPNRVLAEEPSCGWIEVSGTVVVEIRFRIQFAGSVLERIG